MTPLVVPLTISVIIPTFKREKVLIDTLTHVLSLLQPGDEILVIDQTLHHERTTTDALKKMASAGTIGWHRRSVPQISAAMNAGSLLARGDILLFLDDDVIPCAKLLEAHRRHLSQPEAPPATSGQVLQPWQPKPVQTVRDYALRFDAAYDQPCSLLTLMAGNFGIRRETFLSVGGMDENFTGPSYRLETEFSQRLFRCTGRKVRFVPEASLLHLQSDGGTRAFGDKDAWGHLGGAIGDYYFAWRCLPCLSRVVYCWRRFFRAPLNRYTLRHPWLIPFLFVREGVAWCCAVARVWTRPNNYLKDAATYEVAKMLDTVAV